MDELFSRDCPPGINPETKLVLKVSNLRRVLEVFMTRDGLGYLPA